MYNPNINLRLLKVFFQHISIEISRKYSKNKKQEKKQPTRESLIQLRQSTYLNCNQIWKEFEFYINHKTRMYHKMMSRLFSNIYFQINIFMNSFCILWSPLSSAEYSWCVQDPLVVFGRVLNSLVWLLSLRYYPHPLSILSDSSPTFCFRHLRVNMIIYL